MKTPGPLTIFSVILLCLIATVVWINDRLTALEDKELISLLTFDTLMMAHRHPGIDTYPIRPDTTAVDTQYFNWDSVYGDNHKVKTTDSTWSDLCMICGQYVWELRDTTVTGWSIMGLTTCPGLPAVDSCEQFYEVKTQGVGYSFPAETITVGFSPVDSVYDTTWTPIFGGDTVRTRDGDIMLHKGGVWDVPMYGHIGYRYFTVDNITIPDTTWLDDGGR